MKLRNGKLNKLQKVILKGGRFWIWALKNVLRVHVHVWVRLFLKSYGTLCLFAKERKKNQRVVLWAIKYRMRSNDHLICNFWWVSLHFLWIWSFFAAIFLFFLLGRSELRPSACETGCLLQQTEHGLTTKKISWNTLVNFSVFFVNLK